MTKTQFYNQAEKDLGLKRAYLYILKRTTDIVELHKVLTSARSVRQKKEWLYGVDLYDNKITPCYEHNFDEGRLDFIWESWVNANEQNI